jgi:hypothetical protein
VTALGYHRLMKLDRRMAAGAVLTAAGFVLLGYGGGEVGVPFRAQVIIGIGALCLATVLSFFTKRW